MIGGKSRQNQEKVLGHLYLSEPMDLPRNWWLTLHSSPTALSDPTATSELSDFPPLTDPIRILGWVRAAQSSRFIDRARVANRYDIYLPSPGEEPWLITHYGIWDSPELTNLLHWVFLESPYLVRPGRQAVISAGQLLIEEG